MNNKSNELKQKNYFVAVIDGIKVQTLKEFIWEIGKAFKFPSYYGENIAALSECINDLDWIPEKNYTLLIQNFSTFLNQETEENKEYILNFLNGVRAEWANVPNFDGEERYRHKADFKILKK